MLAPHRVSDGRELLRVGQDTPDRLPRGEYRICKARIPILEQTDDLHQQQFVLLAQLPEGGLRLALVKRLELRQQIIYLILQRQLRK
jgi:hypothetical protein